MSPKAPERHALESEERWRRALQAKDARFLALTSQSDRAVVEELVQQTVHGEERQRELLFHLGIGVYACLTKASETQTLRLFADLERALIKVGDALQAIRPGGFAPFEGTDPLVSVDLRLDQAMGSTRRATTRLRRLMKDFNVVARPGGRPRHTDRTRFILNVLWYLGRFEIPRRFHRRYAAALLAMAGFPVPIRMDDLMKAAWQMAKDRERKERRGSFLVPKVPLSPAPPSPPKTYPKKIGVSRAQNTRSS